MCFVYIFSVIIKCLYIKDDDECIQKINAIFFKVHNYLMTIYDPHIAKLEAALRYNSLRRGVLIKLYWCHNSEFWDSLIGRCIVCAVQTKTKIQNSGAKIC